MKSQSATKILLDKKIMEDFQLRALSLYTTLSVSTHVIELYIRNTAGSLLHDNYRFINGFLFILKLNSTIM